MIVLDSSVWIEIFTGGPKAASFRQFLQDLSSVFVPAVVVYEVYKLVKRNRGESDALQAIALMQQARLVPLDESGALTAADISLEYSLPMADALVYAAALEKGCRVATCDAHFRSLPLADYFE